LIGCGAQFSVSIAPEVVSFSPSCKVPVFLFWNLDIRWIARAKLYKRGVQEEIGVFVELQFSSDVISL
jgi:hypothetical protein